MPEPPVRVGLGVEDEVGVREVDEGREVGVRGVDVPDVDVRDADVRDEEEPDDVGVLPDAAFLVVGLGGVDFLAAPPPEDDGFGGVFLAAAFQLVPQAMHARSVRALLVSHSGQRQSAVGRPPPLAGRLAAGRGAPPAGAAPFLPPVGADFLARGLSAAPDGPGEAAPRRRVPPHTSQDVSPGPL
ncbi:hypothetical protein ABZZ79_18250 [Streptomyces sp. NPDC006458]|uniref:hypothetical protein n=1 Tax=Streptomyces sp. NPDC006458 TaxID=3154302 RepID=UPI0033A34FF8